MESPTITQATSSQAPTLPVSSATPLSLLDLNKIRLDVKHTVLTPDYLENLKSTNT